MVDLRLFWSWAVVRMREKHFPVYFDQLDRLHLISNIDIFALSQDQVETALAKLAESEEFKLRKLSLKWMDSSSEVLSRALVKTEEVFVRSTFSTPEMAVRSLEDLCGSIARCEDLKTRKLTLKVCQKRNYIRKIFRPGIIIRLGKNTKRAYPASTHIPGPCGPPSGQPYGPHMGGGCLLFSRLGFESNIYIGPLWAIRILLRVPQIHPTCYPYSAHTPPRSCPIFTKIKPSFSPDPAKLYPRYTLLSPKSSPYVPLIQIVDFKSTWR